MALSETDRELLAHLDALTRTSISRQLDRFTTARIASELSLSRSRVSECLNALVREGLVIKAGGRPLYYFHRKSLERQLQVKLTSSSFASVDTLLAKGKHVARTGFERAIGFDQSLSFGIEQCMAALEYPPNGLPMLVLGERGTGKRFFAQCAFEYAKDKGLLEQTAELRIIDCPRYAEAREGLLSAAKSMSKNQGLVVFKDAHAIPFDMMDAIIKAVSGEGCGDEASNTKGRGPLRLMFLTSSPAEDDRVVALSRRIPIIISIPAFRDRSIQEREALVLQFLRNEGMRMGMDVKISRGALRCLSCADFSDNIRELQACVTTCCAEAFLRRRFDALEIKTYQLPPRIIKPDLESTGKDDARLIDAICGDDAVKEDVSIRMLRAILDACSDLRAGDDSSVISIDDVTERVHDFEDYLLFEWNASGARPETYEQVLAGLFTRVGERFGVDLSRKCARFAALEICLQLRFDSRLSTWEQKGKERLSAALEILSRKMRSARVALDEMSDGVSQALGIDLALSLKIPLLVMVHALIAPAARTVGGIVLSHGYATASSIADAANRILKTRLFEAIDMPYDQSVSDIIAPLQRNIDRFAGCSQVAMLVDMGSLGEIDAAIAVPTEMTIGVINNASTGLAVEVGARLLAGESLNDAFQSAANLCAWGFKILEGKEREEAILFSADGGIAAADKIRALVARSLNRDISLKLVSCGLQQLQRNGLKDAAFSRYSVRAIIGTRDPGIQGVPFIALEDIISGERNQLDTIIASHLDADGMARFHQELVKNLTLQNVVGAISILDPSKLFREIDRGISELQRSTGKRIEGRLMTGLYVHLCCLVERLVTRSPIENYIDEEGFSTDHQDFIDAFRTSFADISSRYKVEIPIAEIAYVFDFIVSGENAEQVPDCIPDDE